MRRFSFWQKWLLVIGIVVVLFGIFTSAVGLMSINLRYINSVFWEAGVAPPGMKAFQNWIYGVYGAMAISFGLFIVFITRNAFRKKDKWTWGCLMLCILIWYGLDMFFSMRFRVYTGAIANSILFVLLLLPLLFTRKDLMGAN